MKVPQTQGLNAERRSGPAGVGPADRPHLVRDELNGALEEIYFKNVSAENRQAYLFADDNRKMGTFLIDLSRAPGRALFAKEINAVLAVFETLAPRNCFWGPKKLPLRICCTQYFLHSWCYNILWAFESRAQVLDAFDPAAVQYDGFEKLQLIAGQDFGHSSKTFSSGLWRGNPTPDWYQLALFYGARAARRAAELQCEAGREGVILHRYYFFSSQVPLRRLAAALGHRHPARHRGRP
jgi:hypothetical protein